MTRARIRRREADSSSHRELIQLLGKAGGSLPGERVRFPLTPALRTETGPILGTSTHTFASMAFGTDDGLANRIFDATTVSPVTYPVLVSVTSQTGGRLLSGT